jgi:hypothetical protein
MAPAPILLGVLAALIAAGLMFLWLFEGLESFLAECGMRHCAEPSWRLMRSLQPAWTPYAKLFVVASNSALIGIGVGAAVGMYLPAT